MPKQIICKSCRQPCVVDGTEITCETCGTTFIKQGDEVKVKEIGRIDKIEQRLDALYKKIQTNIEPEPEPEPEPESNLEPKPGKQIDEDNDW